ncbi:MAG TPA: flagellar protein FlgN [Clostridiaceae bacterium]|nr:flagellar protein FlgN [Clostridiaceae bacterium]
MPGDLLAEKLIKALQYEYRTYLEILKIAEKKTDALVKNDAVEVSKITEEEKVMAEQTVKLNQVREQILRSLAEAYDQDYKTLTIEKLKQIVEEPYKNQLGDLQKKMSDLLGKLKTRNGINQKLIENAIRYLDFNIQLLAGPEPAAPTYSKSGTEVSGSSKRSLLDVRY